MEQQSDLRSNLNQNDGNRITVSKVSEMIVKWTGKWKKAEIQGAIWLKYQPVRWISHAIKHKQEPALMIEVVFLLC